jgi:hypothetical protein
MSDNEACLLKSPTRTPWNKGKLTGAKPRCDPNTSGRVGRSSRSKAALATSPCSIWQSTVSFEGVMSSLSGSRMSPPAATRRIAQPSDKRRPGGQSDLN